jgi:hypothetical protein
MTGRRRLPHQPAEKGIRVAGMANRNRGADAVQPRWGPNAGSDRGHEGVEPQARPRVREPGETASLGADKAQEGKGCDLVHVSGPTKVIGWG